MHNRFSNASLTFRKTLCKNKTSKNIINYTFLIKLCLCYDKFYDKIV